MAHILIVDDDAKIRSLLTRYLSGEGFGVSEAADSDAAYSAFKDREPDLILMDLTMPGEDGLAITQSIRRGSDVPIIMLTGKDDPVDKAIGLEVGADDYVAKPFHLRELHARIKTVLRRRSVAPATPDDQNAPDVVEFDGFKVDLGKRQVQTNDNQPIELTSAEFKLLAAFIRNPKHVMNRDQLLDHVAGRAWTPYDRTIDTQIRRLRLKLEKFPDKPELIKTVRGEGYVFTAEVRLPSIMRR